MSGDPKSPSQPQVLYQISGEMGQEFTALNLRDRIRNGTLTAQDQVAIVGTELWKSAGDCPALTRYFSLLKNSAATPAMSAASRQPAGSMAGRIAAGLAYPFGNITSIVFIIAAAGGALVSPLLSFVVGLFASVYALGVIRKSSEGETTAPSAAAVGGAGEWVVGLLQVIAVSLISAWPVVLLTILMMMGLVRSFVLVIAAAIVVLLYYPASLASVAVWKSVKMALSVSQIFRFIGILGVDYFEVIVMWIASFIVIGVGTTFVGRALPRGSRLAAGIIWLLIYASHLLGWAVHRHRDQL